MLKEIIPAITPQNIKDIELLKDGMDIFLDYLVEHSDISIDIKNTFNEDKIPIYEELIKIYMDNIYKVLASSEHNELLYNRLSTMYTSAKLNIEEVDLSIDITKLLTSDYIFTNKAYKESKGTPKAMEYIYNIITRSGIQPDYLDDNLGQFKYSERYETLQGDTVAATAVYKKDGKLVYDYIIVHNDGTFTTEIRPVKHRIFEYLIEGTMISEVYEHFVKPLTHPVGWAYFYQRVFYDSFIDYFNIEFKYHFNGYQVICGTNIDDYTINLSHNNRDLVINSKVISNEVNLSTGTRTITFKSLETLVHTTNNSIILYSESNNIITDYGSSCILKNIGLEVRCMDGDNFSNDDYLANVGFDGNALVQDNTVVLISNEAYGTEGNKTKRTIIYFKSFEQLILTENPRSLKLYDENSQILKDYDNKDAPEDDVNRGNCGLYLNYSTETITTTKDTIDFLWDIPIASTTGKQNIIGAGNVYIGSYVVGDELVNKNISVTYNSFTGKWDGSDFVNLFAAGGETLEDSLDKYGIRWDSNLYFDDMSWVYDDMGILGIAPIPPKTFGYTARDEYEWKQELVKIPFPKLDFEDDVHKSYNWDARGLRWDDFTFDNIFIAEEFVIEHEFNTWDTNLYWDYFQFDAKNTGGGFTYRYDPTVRDPNFYD